MIKTGRSDSKLKRIKSVERKIEQKKADRSFFIKEKPNTLNQDWRGVIKELDDSIKQLNQELTKLKKTSSRSKSKDKSASSTRKSINAIKELKQTKKFLMDMKENVSDIDKDIIKNKEILKRKLTKLNKDIDESLKSIEEIRKLNPGVDLSVYLRDLEISESLKECFKSFPKMHGFVKEIEKYLDQLKSFNSSIENDIKYMKKFSDVIAKYHPDVEIKYDFCELKGFDYESDIIFSAYIESDSEEVAIGGRYDLDNNKTSGIGFSIDIRYLLKNQFLSKPLEKLVNKSGKWFVEDNNE